jgi:hypothetical protein
MSSIGEELRQMFENCPILLDEDFQNQYLGIVDVASFLNSAADFDYKQIGKYDAFDQLGVDNIVDYIKLIEVGNPAALMRYERIRDIFGFE